MGHVAIEFPDGSDVLPQGRHPATPDEIKTELVDAFPSSATRPDIFNQWTILLEALDRFVTLDEQWIDGSFVTKKNDPADIDLVTHLDGEAVEALEPVEAMLLKGLFAGHVSRDMHRCDSFLVARYPEGHPARPEYEKTLAAWDELFGRDRNGDPKGYLELARDEPS
jgi:hypothetical protein